MRISERTARETIAGGRVLLDGGRPGSLFLAVDQHREVRFDGEVLQAGIPRVYVMLHKPRGVVSATSDPLHPTVLDLVDHPWKETLHIAGRLDRSSTGLILLTNDSVWSESLTRPERKVEKVYLVETASPIPDEAVELFGRGFHFLPEDILTRPARLEILSPRRARVWVSEGKYHQVKRMFHRAGGIRLVSLHRERVGAIELPADLAEGAWREIVP